MTPATTQTEFGTFFLPGPTEVRGEILQAMTRPMIPHRGSEFQAMFARIQDRLKVVFATRRPVLVATSSATGLMEAAIRNAPAGRVLALVNGAFSERFAILPPRVAARWTGTRSRGAMSTTCLSSRYASRVHPMR